MKLVLSKDFPASPPRGLDLTIKIYDVWWLTLDLSSVFGPSRFAVSICFDLSDFKTNLTNTFSGYFLTKVFHPNVADNGEICVNTLKKDWKPNLGIKHVLLVGRLLLI